MTLLRADLSRRLCRDALFTAAAMMLSYVEFLLPLSFLPLPGLKLGLANVVTLAVFSLFSWRDAAAVHFLRIALMSLLFGSVTSALFSLAGGLLCYLFLLLSSRCLRACSYIGISVLSAVAHNLGQLLAAAWLFGGSILLSYLPMLLLAAMICGTLTGLLLNLSMPTLQRSIRS